MPLIPTLCKNVLTSQKKKQKNPQNPDVTELESYTSAFSKLPIITANLQII